MKPNPHIALIYHYDLARALDGEPVDWQAIPVNVDAGREGGDLCRAAADFAKRRDLFAMPAPSARTLSDQGFVNSEIAVPVHYDALENAWVDGVRRPDLDHVGPESKKVKLAVPAATSSAVEQPAVDPEPPTASSVVPRSAVECDCPRGSSRHPHAVHATNCASKHPSLEELFPGIPKTDPVVVRQRIRNRIKDLIAAGHEQTVRQFWPQTIPPLSRPGHTDDQLEAILTAVRRVEAEVGAPFHPDDSPPPQSRAAAQRALAAWGDDINGAWMAASLIATFEQCRLPDCTLEGLVGQFSIEQCERLWGAAPK